MQPPADLFGIGRAAQHRDDEPQVLAYGGEEGSAADGVVHPAPGLDDPLEIVHQGVIDPLAHERGRHPRGVEQPLVRDRGEAQPGQGEEMPPLHDISIHDGGHGRHCPGRVPPLVQAVIGRHVAQRGGGRPAERVEGDRLAGPLAEQVADQGGPRLAWHGRDGTPPGGVHPAPHVTGMATDAQSQGGGQLVAPRTKVLT